MTKFRQKSGSQSDGFDFRINYANELENEACKKNQQERRSRSFEQREISCKLSSSDGELRRTGGNTY